MRKRLVLFLMLLISINILTNAEPYKPKPILWVHGYSSNSKCWGAGTNIGTNGKRTNEINVDSIEINSAYNHFLPYMKPYAWAWYNWEKEREMAKSVNIFHSSVKILYTFGRAEIISNGIARLVILA